MDIRWHPKRVTWNLEKLMRVVGSLMAHPSDVRKLFSHLVSEGSRFAANLWRCHSPIPFRDLEELFPGISQYPIPLNGVLDDYLIAAIASYFKVKVAFEFGTAQGITTLRVAEAMNAGEGGMVITVDLPPDTNPALLEASWINATTITKAPGEVLKTKSLEKTTIRQVLCDSRLLDISEFSGKVDLVYIDGGHDYEVVKNDSEKAFQLLNPAGPRIVLWHDYTPGHFGVVFYLNELYKEKPLIRICKTPWVIWSPCIPQNLKSKGTPRDQGDDLTEVSPIFSEK